MCILRMMDWLERKTEEFFQSDDTTQMENTYCIVRNFLNNFSQYDKLVVRYSKAKQENRPNNIFLANENEIEKTELLGHCQAEKIGFEYDLEWTTRQFGSKLVDELEK